MALWQTSPLTARSLELLLGDWRGTGSAYEALAERIRLLIVDGRIAVDTRLPAERDLADRLGLSRTTVTAAYRHLREQGNLHSVRGSGSVARLQGAPAMLPAPLEAEYIDFSKAAPPALPWLTEVVRQAVDDLPAHLSDAGFDPIGTPALRQAIADRYTARGLPTAPEQIMVTIGAQHAIALLSRALIGRGRPRRHRGADLPARLRGAPGRRGPPRAGAGGAARGRRGRPRGDRRPRAGHPALQSGAGLPDPRLPEPDGSHDEPHRPRPGARRRRAAGTVVVADETTAELSIDRPGQFPPMAADGPAVLIGSVGKTVWGGLRVGWIRAERPLIRRLLAVRSPGDLGTPILEQLIVTRLIPRMDEILELRREQLRAGRDRLEELLSRYFPEWDVPHVDGGIVTWVGIGSSVSSQLVLAARREGLIVAAGPRFGVDGAFERFLRLPICYSPETTDAAVQALARAWRSLAHAPTAEPEPELLASVI